MGALWNIRIVCLVSVVHFSFAVAALGAFYLSKFDPFDLPGILSNTIPVWTILSLVVAALSIIFIILIYCRCRLVIDFVRKGALTSRILVELIVFSILSVLWLAAAAHTTVEFNLNYLLGFGLPKTCGGVEASIPFLQEIALSNPLQYGYLLDANFDSFGVLCHSHDAIQALGFLNWVILMGYAIALLTCALVARSRGHPSIWKSTVRNMKFLEQSNNQLPREEKTAPVPMNPEAMQQNNHYMSGPSMNVVSQTVTPPSTGAGTVYLPQV